MKTRVNNSILICLFRRHLESLPLMADGFKRLSKGKQTFTWYATKNFLKPPEDFSMGLELAKESLAADFGFIEVTEIFYSY